MQISLSDFLTPQLIKVEEYDKYHSKVVLEPLERGFGLTMCNALPRILLSYMEGSAIKEVEINGVIHEYCTIESVQGDVIQRQLEFRPVDVFLQLLCGTFATLNTKGPVTVTE